MARPYRDFSTLILNTEKGIDYDLTVVERGGEVTVTAIHGGSIEPLTGELAATIAEGEHNLYIFQGLCSRENDALRIPPSRYDEVRLHALLQRSQVALSVEGIDGETEVVGMGGQNRRLQRILREALEAAGWKTGKLSGVVAAHNPALFFNCPAQGGVQLELSRAVRAAMIDGPLTGFSWQEEARWNERFYAFVDVVRASLERYLVELNADLDRTMERFERATDAFPPSMRDGGHRHGKDEA
ncbi:MAG: poly-gamma-glutamate hydrolase family protein [Chloroflexota bacterium]|nr:poly-gamma-glutamate hydrolase family protein [Chloroflexota bacterium]